MFCDEIGQVTLRSGAARIELVSYGPDGNPFICGILVVPFNELPNLSRQIQNAVEHLTEQVRTTNSS